MVNGANLLPTTLAPAVAPLLLSITALTVLGRPSGPNYAMLFIDSALCALIGAVTLLRVKAVR